MALRPLGSFKSLPITDNKNDTQGNIKVFCRFRPLNQKELNAGEGLPIKILSDSCISMKNQYDDSPLLFAYDRIFGPESSQQEVYEIAALPIIESVTEGFNGTVFAYGQTSSGKTYTMTGPDTLDPASRGIIPRMAESLFTLIKAADPSAEFSVKVAFYEIYLEKIRDLIETKNILKISENKTRGVVIQGLKEEYVRDSPEILSFINRGNKNREVAFTSMNEYSSRSHSIFQITVTQTDTRDLSAKTGKLYLVDLAGSEKANKSKLEGKRLDEAKYINKSLSALGLVIYSLTDSKSNHVPYRDSKLTRILQDSLGGNSKTCLIITCSPSGVNKFETLSTLRFGIRAKSVKNKPKVNKELSVDELKLMLKQANDLITEKENRIISIEKTLKEKPENSEIAEKIENLEEELRSEKAKLLEEKENSAGLGQILTEQLERNTKLLKENSSLNSKLLSLIEALQEMEYKLRETEEENSKSRVMIQTRDQQISDISFMLKTQECRISQELREIERIPLEFCSVREKMTQVSDVRELQKQKREKEDHSKSAYTQIMNESIDVTLADTASVDYSKLDLTCPIIKYCDADWEARKDSLISGINQKELKIQEMKYDRLESRLYQKEIDRNRCESDRKLKQKFSNLEERIQQLSLSYFEIEKKTRKKEKKEEKLRVATESMKRLEKIVKIQSEECETLRMIEEESTVTCQRVKKNRKGQESKFSKY